MRLPRLLVLLLLPLVACSQIWTELRAAEIADGMEALPNYHARYVEHGILPDRPKVDVVHDLLYQKPGKVRVETISPADRKGDLYIYDGSTAIYWWPAELTGIRIRGLHAPDGEAVRAYIKQRVADALRDYAWSLRGNEKVAGQTAAHWAVLPMAKGADYMPFEEWRHADYQFPLKIVVTDQGGKPWYAFEFTEFQQNAPMPAKAFAFEFPTNALVFEWNLDDPGITLDAARKAMNFTVREPARLPEGHRIRKIVRAHGQVPMVALLMDKGATWLSLTQNRYAGRGGYELPVGRKVQVGKAAGFANFFGATTTLNWVQGGTELTLVGNLPYAQMMDIAASVQ